MNLYIQTDFEKLKNYLNFVFLFQRLQVFQTLYLLRNRRLR